MSLLNTMNAVTLEVRMPPTTRAPGALAELKRLAKERNGRVGVGLAYSNCTDLLCRVKFDRSPNGWAGNNADAGECYAKFARWAKDNGLVECKSAGPRAWTVAVPPYQA